MMLPESGMKVYPCDVDIQAARDVPLQMFLLQWHTPAPMSAQDKINPVVAATRCALLEHFRDWLIAEIRQQPADSPVFIIAPELSMPQKCWSVLDEITKQIDRQTIIIAGFEYLDWTEYTTLLTENAFNVPEPAMWIAGGDENHSVNAAGVWIRDKAGDICKYIQPKLHPYHEEEAFLYRGKVCLLFRSQDQTPGARMNFCLQICSDLVNPESVLKIRREIAQYCTTPLDLTVVLQRNENQEADQFKRAAQAYFKVPDQMVDTDQGALLFVNTANDVNGESSSWGGSRFHFRYSHRWKVSSGVPPTTYWFEDDGPNDHQRVIFRECGPAVHWVKYRLAYLVSRIPGGGHVLPFEATCSLISGDRFHYGGTECRFVRLAAVPHWFESRCRDHEADLQDYFENNDVAKSVREQFLNEYRSAARSWKATFENRNKPAQDALSTYFECWPKEDGYPQKQEEPRKWSPDVARGLGMLLNTYVDLQIGTTALPGSDIQPDFRGIRHAKSGNVGITFLWGDTRRSAESMIQSYKSAQNTRGLADRAAKHYIVVLINPAGPPNLETADDSISDEPDIIEAEPPSVGSIVRVPPPRLTILENSQLNGLLHEATEAVQHRNLLETRLRRAFE